MRNSRSLQIYLKPGVSEDDLLLSVWEACREHARPQDIFRSMLSAGLMAMVENGTLPESVVEECNLDLLIEKRRRRKSRKMIDEQPLASSPSGYGHFYPGIYPAPPAHLAQPFPVQPHYPGPSAPQHTPSVQTEARKSTSDNVPGRETSRQDGEGARPHVQAARPAADASVEAAPARGETQQKQKNGSTKKIGDLM